MASSNIPVFSSLVNRDYRESTTIDPRKIELEMLSKERVPEDDSKTILERFHERIRNIESSTGVNLDHKESEAPTKPILRRPPPAENTFSFQPAPHVPPQRTEREAYGGAEPSFGGPSFTPEPSFAQQNYRPSTYDDYDDDDEDDEPVSSKTRLGAAMHRVNLAPINEDLGPREEMGVEEMFRDIDIFCHYLKASKVDISGITIPDPSQASYHEVKRVHTLLLTLYGSSTYKSLGEEAIFGFSSAIEYVFDGSMLVFNKFPISYKGLRRNMMTKFRSNAPVITNAATQVASYYGISPSTVALFDMLSPLFTTPIRNASGMDGPITNEAMAEGLGSF